MRELVVGSRGSELALQQARQVISNIIKLRPNVSCRIEIIKTTGDRVQDVPLSQIGDKGLFVKEIELALLNAEIDFAVHSAKDLPSEMDERLIIAAYPEREDVRDALVSKTGTLSELPEGAVVGTSSARRKAQILYARPDLKVTDLRGNLDTRLRKLCGSNYDAIIVACAGLRRLHLDSRITEMLPTEVCLPAAGQGALAVQCRNGDPVVDVVRCLDDYNARVCVSAERVVLSVLEAGCRTPVGVNAQILDGVISIYAMVASADGTQVIKRSLSGSHLDAMELGRRLAGELLCTQAKEWLHEVRSGGTPTDMGAAG